MGLAKELDIMYHKRGYRTCDKKVCRDCIGNHSLKAYIKEYGEMSTCDYCNCRRKVVTIDTLMEPIMSGIGIIISCLRKCKLQVCMYRDPVGFRNPLSSIFVSAPVLVL